MKAVPPIPINLISSSVPSTTVPDWNISTSYSIDDLVLYTDNNIYKALTANTGKQPDISPEDWSDQGAENRWAMFDDYVSSVTDSGTTTMSVTLGFNNCDTFSLFNIVANTVTATLNVDSVEVWSKVINLVDAGSNITDWYEYFFGPIESESDHVETGVPIYGSNAELTLEFEVSSGTVQCGHCTMGLAQFVGLTNYGIEIGIISYGKKDVNQFGQAYLKQGAFAKRANLTAFVKPAQMDAIFKRFAALREVPCTWILNNSGATSGTDFESLLLFGFWRDFQLEISNPSTCGCSAEIEGLT